MDTNEKLMREWGKALESNDINRVEELIEQGMDIDTPVWRYYSFENIQKGEKSTIVERKYEAAPNGLVYSIYRGCVQMAEFFLKKGVDPNERMDNDETPLIAAVRVCLEGNEPNEDIINLLIDYKADMEMRDRSGYTSYDINNVAHKGDGFTALMWAVNFDKPNIVDLLVRRGAKFSSEVLQASFGAHFEESETYRVLMKHMRKQEPERIKLTYDKMLEIAKQNGYKSVEEAVDDYKDQNGPSFGIIAY